MAKKYTIIVIDDKGSPIRETAVSKRWLNLCICMMLSFLVFTGWGVYRYNHLQQSLMASDQLKKQVVDQNHEIQAQRKQIQAFADTVNALKDKLISLNQFEQKIRIMANLEHRPDQAPLFGVGGSAPEDLDPSVPLNRNHSRLMRQMHEQIHQVSNASAVQQKSFKALMNSLKDKKNLLAATPSLRPTHGWISSDFGYRISPFTNRKEFHRGLDIAARAGTPIIAPADGVVTYSGKKWLYGNMIALNHGYGMVTRYGHISKLLKKRGEKVKRGETIALIGSTGRSTGPHVHYEVRLHGVPVNPAKYILD